MQDIILKIRILSLAILQLIFIIQIATNKFTPNIQLTVSENLWYTSKNILRFVVYLLVILILTGDKASFVLAYIMERVLR